MISLLPTLPTAWQEGSVTGLRARGGVEVDIEWSGGDLKQAILHGEEGKSVLVEYRGLRREVKCHPSGSKVGPDTF
jgi:alpha-L-fucosidase 2